jgi:hypothetical protein
VKKPKHLFRERRIPDSIRRLIEAITRESPELGRALRLATPALLDPACPILDGPLSDSERGGVLVAWRNAVQGLAAGLSCDICLATQARGVRLLHADRPDQFGTLERPYPSATFLAFALVCGECGRGDSDALVRRLLGRLGTLRDSRGRPLGIRPVIFGRRIGAAGALPARHALETCVECEEMTWIDRDALDALGLGDRPPTILCWPCAERCLAGGVPGLELTLGLGIAPR